MPDFDYRALFDSLCLEAGLVCRLSFDMPEAYEEANGMYDPETDIVFVNATLLKGCSDSQKAFYLFHELRHAEQYAHPERFPSAIRKALDYDIAYDGNCSKRVNGQWISCRLDGGEDRFTRLYLSNHTKSMRTNLPTPKQKRYSAAVRCWRAFAPFGFRPLSYL